jgi:hypothetical protein
MLGYSLQTLGLKLSDVKFKQKIVQIYKCKQRKQNGNRLVKSDEMVGM